MIGASSSYCIYCGYNSCNCSYRKSFDVTIPIDITPSVKISLNDLLKEYKMTDDNNADKDKLIQELQKKIMKAIVRCEIYIECEEGDPLNSYLEKIIEDLTNEN